MQLPATGLAGGGDRTISFANMHTKETLTVTYVRNGRHVPEALKKINHMLRDWRRNEAIEMDPDNDEGWRMAEGTGLELAIGMWLTRDTGMRAYAEDLLRTAFNAHPEDGSIAQALTRFYLDLAEELLRMRDPSVSDEDRRTEMDNLLKNMLTLSDRARRILSRKLYKIGREVESGDRGLRDARRTDRSPDRRRSRVPRLARAARGRPLRGGASAAIRTERRRGGGVDRRADRRERRARHALRARGRRRCAGRCGDHRPSRHSRSPQASRRADAGWSERPP